jgi:gluconolactonase
VARNGGGSLTELGLVDEDARLEVVASGFKYTEGPVWDVDADALIFHELIDSVRFRWSEREGLVEELRPTNWSNGMAFDAEGRLLICECGANSVLRREQDGTVTTLVSHYEGRELNSPNDIVVASSGDIYFTDPAYGRLPVYGVDRSQDLDFQGIYRIREGDGELELLSRDGCEQPNGLCFSPDESILYVNDTQVGHVWQFDMEDDGRLGQQRMLLASVGPAIPWDVAQRNEFGGGYVDGMKCDCHGNVYVTGPGGVWVISPDGEHLGVIESPVNVSNLAWGGADGNELFLSCNDAIRRLRMNVTGSPVPGSGRSGRSVR